MALNKADFLKPVLKEVKIEDLNGSVYLRRLKGRERKDYLNSLPKMEGTDQEQINENYDALYDSMIKLVYMTVCDEQGNKLFEDKEQLYDIDGAILEELYLNTHKHNKLGVEDFKDAVKN